MDANESLRTEPNEDLEDRKLAGSLLVTCPTGRGNALGRALALAQLASAVVERVMVVAPDDGPLWPAASRWQIPVMQVNPYGRSPRHPDLDLTDLRWVWVFKPVSLSWKYGLAAAGSRPGVGILLDIDDDDEALSRQFASLSLWNRLRLHRMRQLHPARIIATRDKAIPRADAITVSSYAIGEHFGPFNAAPFRVPHPRSIAGSERTRPQYSGGEKHVGYYGTIRSYKGLDRIARLLEVDPSVVVHVFAGSDLSALSGYEGRVVEHPVDESWAAIHDSVDVILLPQHRSPGADIAVPTKLIDAMRFGAPIIATPTDPIREIAADTVLYHDDWSNPQETVRIVDRSLAEGDALGRAARGRFEQELSIEATTPGLRSLLESLVPQAPGTLVSASG